MFNSDFFPTPESVISEMLYGIDVTNKIILEPSAGKGNIVDYLKASDVKEVLCCELNEDLRKILSSKCRIISNDFMTVTSDMISHIDMIVMNPPFSADEKHILHAWEIAPDGCKIISLINWNTYDNDYSRCRRELRAKVREYGTIIKLGSVFTDSERNTDVNIGLITLQKPGINTDDEFEGFLLEEEPEENGENGIMSYDFVRDVVNRYIGAIKLYDKQLELGIQMDNLTSSFYGSSLAFSCTKDNAPVLRTDFKKELQKSAWKWLFSKFKMAKYTTKGLEDDMNKFVERQTHIPFTMKNIYIMIDIIIGTTASRMDKAIIEVFDRLTNHYHDNRYNVEGWKTNSHYLMGQKFILPYISRISYGGYLEISYNDYYSKIIEDMMKALCYITGKNWDKEESLWDFFHKKTEETKNHDYNYNLVKYDFGKWYDWGFFEIKGYKKGTMHFKFKDLEVWGKFNQEVARIKGYPLFEHVSKK